MEVFKDQHNLFPIELSHLEVVNAVVGSSEEVAYLRHRRFGHLNFHGLQFLQRRNMVLGLPKMFKMQ